MAARYVFDANVFMSLQQRQPPDIYPSVWKKLAVLMEEGIVISSREVYDEIQRGDDTLVKWAAERKEFFLDSEIEVQQVVREILKDYRGLVEGGKKPNNADPFVIALAKLKKCIVVTEESLSGNIDSPKIPDVCACLNITYTNFVGFSRDMKLTF